MLTCRINLGKTQTIQQLLPLVMKAIRIRKKYIDGKKINESNYRFYNPFQLVILQI